MSDESEKEPKNSVQLAQKWEKEICKSKIWFRKFWKRGDKVNKSFLDEHRDDDDSIGVSVSRLNLFHANITTLMSMLYGRIPKVEVTRRFADADDDVSRVAGVILTRILNTDIEAAGEDVASVFRSSLQDRLLPGLGTARLQYQYNSKKETTKAIVDDETGDELAPAVENDRITDEWTDIVYTHWKDVLWSPCRTYGEVRWRAYRSFLNRKKLKTRFKNINLDKVNFSSKGALGNNRYKEGIDDNVVDQAEAEVWEIWDKTTRKVYWYLEGYPGLLDQQDDPLDLAGFWPEPPPMLANCTTSKYLPKADYDLAKSLYQEIDELETRISLLTEACKCVGVYDKNNKGVERIFNEAVENQLIPVDNWAQFAEKGGLDGCIAWVPLEDVVNTISVLTQKQNDKIQQLYQVTGMNDVMRGAAQKEGTPVSATERKIQDNYGSIRIEALQNEFARWVSDTQSIKAEIIAKLYQPYCIIEQSNIMDTMDGQNQELIQAAVALIKDPTKSQWKINVRPETLAIADYAQLKADRMEFMMGLAQFMQSMGPLLEIEPGAMPTLMKLLKWGLAGFRGSSEIEGVIDQQIEQLQKQPQQPKPNPEADKAKLEMEKMKAEMEMEQQKSAMEMQMAREKHASEMELAKLKLQLEQKKMEMELVYLQKELEMKMQMKEAELAIKVKGQQADAAAQASEQEAQFAFNTAEREHEAEVSMESGDAELERDRERAKLKSDGANDNA